MLEAVGEDDRIRGLLQFYGANRTGRWAGRLVQVPVSITANGSYDAMRGFVQAVQGINRIAVPEDVTYTLDKGGDATKNNVTINCKIWSLLLNNDTVEDENVTKQ